jgi:hypothetical protein
MGNVARLQTLLPRAASLSTLRYLLLVASDPRYGPLFASLRKSSPLDRLQAPSLWFAWRAEPIVEQELAGRNEPRVLEWGAGGSTRWFAQRASAVVSIEHHDGWFELCRQYVEPNVDLRHIPVGPSYAAPDVDYSKLDCIIIDGVMRVECAQTVANRVADGRIRKGTLVIFDNSERDAYLEGIEALEACCTRWRSFTGPTGIDIDQMTTLFWV